jgi:hypothetical protein
VTHSGVSQGERAAGQRRAARELAAILDTHPHLPAIAWTVATAGSMLAGQVNGQVPAGQVRQAFEAWQAALMLADDSELASGPALYLRARGRRHRVQIALAATVFDDEDREQAW